jgi:hypothetical protein
VFLKYKISQHILAAQNLKFKIGQNVTENNKCHQTFCWQKMTYEK